MRAWKHVVDSLVKEKSKFVFGLIAGPWEFWDYLSETDIQPILVRHELSSVFMAMAHARLTSKPGICVNSQGPGVANMFAGFLEAQTGCIPVIAPVPCSEMKTEGYGQFQETEMVPSFKHVSKWAYRLTKQEKIPWAMRRALNANTRDEVPAIIEFVVSTFDFPEGFHEFHEIAWGKPVRPVEK